MFDAFPILLNFAFFIGLASFVWVSGTRLSYFIDAIAEQTNLSRGLLGLILLATATELPEFVTTLTATTSGDGPLALNNMFGGMLLQLFVLAIADLFVKKAPLTSQPIKPDVAIAGLLCITSMIVILGARLLGDATLAFHIGVGSSIIGGLYILSMYILWRMQGHKSWSPVDLPEDKIAEHERKNRYDEISLTHLIMYSAIAAIVILACGVLLVRLADTLAAQTGLGTTFIGATLLALTTSLPELSTAIAAVRVKAYTMAISNVFGSNIIMTFLLFPNDVVFMGGSLINEINPAAMFALCAGIFMTAIYCIGLITRSHVKIFRMGLDSLLVTLCYIGSVYVIYSLR